MGVINYLIWLDQVNGVFLGVALFNKSILNLLPFPLIGVLGSEFCDWIDLPGCIYLVGSFVWSSITAVYRVLYMKCFSWMKDIIGNLPRFVGRDVGLLSAAQLATLITAVRVRIPLTVSLENEVGGWKESPQSFSSLANLMFL